MGRTLQIRVSAWTFDPTEVEKRWPRLVALGFSPPVLLAQERGVLELTDHLVDRHGMGVLPEPAQQALTGPIRRAGAARERLTAALAEWNARAANTATDDIEEALDEAEQEARKLKLAPGLD
ncbi:MAG: hypothetical protein P4L39_08625 [Humidesulfovibrio sp.]|nr:hypothetical protein [Humidesulfovibrio sp.]